MAQPHIHPGQVANVLPFGARLAQEKSVALFKSKDLEVIRLVLLKGKSMPPHRVPGEITIHCIEGELLVSTDDGTCVLAPGHLLYLQGGAMHGVTASQDASALVTVTVRA